MKKKKILFVHFDLQGGGAEKVLVTLLNQLSRDKYDITLQTIFGVGPNLNDIPKDINFRFLFRRIFRGANTIMKLFTPRFLHRLFVKDKFDVEIGYLETSPTRIISGSQNPKSKKYAWVHVEIENLTKFLVGFKSKKEAVACYNMLDGIYCVSETVKESFKTHFPEVTTPVRVVYNVNDYDKIIALSKCPVELDTVENFLNICSVGRLVSQKRFDRLINAANDLIKQGYRFHLYILGEGSERKNLESLILEYGISSYVKLLGYDLNPYKYIAKMDLFVCSSIKEGYSTAASEAIALNVPVLTTDVSGMKEMLNNGEYGIIVNNDEESLKLGLKKILDEECLLKKFKSALMKRPPLSTKNFVSEYEKILDI